MRITTTTWDFTIRTEDKTDFVLGAAPLLHDLIDLYELFFFVIAELTTSSQKTTF